MGKRILPVIRSTFPLATQQGSNGTVKRKSTSDGKSHHGRRSQSAVVARETGIVDLELKELRASFKAFLDGVKEGDFICAYNNAIDAKLFEKSSKLNSNEITALKNVLIKCFITFANAGQISKVIDDAVKYLNYPNDPYSCGSITAILHAKIRDYLHKGLVKEATDIWLICPRNFDVRLGKENLKTFIRLNKKE